MIRYNRQWPDEMSALEIELVCFRERFPATSGALGPEQHFKNIVDTLWGGSPDPPLWNAWTDLMLARACQHRYLSVTGCANSGKSHFFALWALVSWLSAPSETMVLVTSTSLKESRKRIWAYVTERFLQVKGLPGRLADSVGIIRFDPGDGGPCSDRAGISLIAGEKKQEKGAIGKLIGMKQRYVIVVADELPELSESLVEAAKSNLETNPYFQFVGLGNAASRFDPHGVLSEPRRGWGSVTEDSVEWATRLGWCVRLDGHLSPNILLGEKKFPWLIDQDRLEKFRDSLGENSAAYWRMVRAFWSPEGMTDGCYAEADIVRFGGMDTEVLWSIPPVKVAGFDPAFQGTNKAVIVWGNYGTDVSGIKTLCFLGHSALAEDLSNPDPRSIQIADALIRECQRLGVLPERLAIDSTGPQSSFADIVNARWSNKPLRVDFSGMASDRPVSATDATPSNRKFVNRVTELWMIGQRYLRSGQIKGITPDMAAQMTARKLFSDKGAAGVRLRVEAKEVMRSRMSSRSPDIADAAFVAIDLCRTRLGFMPLDRIVGDGNLRLDLPSSRKPVARMPSGWSAKRKFLDVTSRSKGFFGGGVENLR